MSKAIILYQFPRAGQFPNFSPFCMKVETYLRMVPLEYTTVSLVDPGKSKAYHKLPFIQYGQESIGDSSEIIARLEKASAVPLDHHLTHEQHAEKICVQRMLEEHLYWAIVYSRWCSTLGWPAWSAMLKKKLPPLIGDFILNRLQARASKQLYSQGTGRFDEEDIFKRGVMDLEALNTKMGDRRWYFNEMPSTLDAIIYSFIGSCLSSFWPSPLKDYVLLNENMVQYYNQMQEQYFPELKRFEY